MDWKRLIPGLHSTQFMYGTKNSPRKSTIIGLWSQALEKYKHISLILQSIDLILACGLAHSPCLWVCEVGVNWPSLASADNCFLILSLHNSLDETTHKLKLASTLGFSGKRKITPLSKNGFTNEFMIIDRSSDLISNSQLSRKSKVSGISTPKNYNSKDRFKDGVNLMKEGPKV